MAPVTTNRQNGLSAGGFRYEGLSHSRHINEYIQLILSGAFATSPIKERHMGGFRLGSIRCPSIELAPVFLGTEVTPLLGQGFPPRDVRGRKRGKTVDPAVSHRA